MITSPTAASAGPRLWRPKGAGRLRRHEGIGTLPSYLCARISPKSRTTFTKKLARFPDRLNMLPHCLSRWGGNRVWGIFGNGDPRQRKAIWQLSTSKRVKKDQSVPKRVPKNVPKTQFRQIKRCNSILVDPLERGRTACKLARHQLGWPA